MTTLWRTSALAERHHALGATLEDWNGMGTAFRYAGADTADHHAAIRTQAGLMDVSGLKKIHCVGPHAKVLLDHATTRDMSKLYPGKSVYATMLNEAGKFVDDCIVYCLAPNAYLVVHGTGLGQEMLTLGALGRNVSLMFDDDLHDLSLQGPLAVDFLEKHVESIRDLRYFHHLQTRLFGFDVMISRTGYTGERGYEIFARPRMLPLCGTKSSTRVPPWASCHAVSRHSIGYAWKVTCCSIPLITPRHTPSPTSPPATRYGSWGWTSPYPRTRPSSGGRRTLPPQGQGALQDLWCID